MKLHQLMDFITERHAIYMRKTLIEDGRPPRTKRARAAWGMGGWTRDHLTDDPILHEYRFTNVYRELDRVTVWIRENIQEPFWDHPNLWLMLCIARQINWPDALIELIFVPDAWPSSKTFKPSRMAEVLEARKTRGEKVETAAYMIRAESHPENPWFSWSKQRYISEIVIGRLWERAHLWQYLLDGHDGQPEMEKVWTLFQEPHYIGWGPFLAYQVVVDMRHTRYLRGAPDINTWCALGPGTKRGLNRLFERGPWAPLPQEKGLPELLEVHSAVNKSRPNWMDPLELSDTANCMCEWDKYQRVRMGQGRPRAKYVPGRGS